MGNSYVKFTDNSDEVISLFHRAKHRGLEAIGLVAETYAKKYITKLKAVDTGRYRNSITYAISGYTAHVAEYQPSKKGAEVGGSYSGQMEGEKDEAVYIGTNVEYGPNVENGTSKMRARPAIKMAATQHGEEYRGLLEESMKNG